MIVLDASVAAELLLDQPSAPAIAATLEGQDIAAPELLGVEMLSILRAWTRGRGLDVTRAQEALIDLEDLGIAWYSDRPLLRVAWGKRDNASAYDAIYLALAETLSVPAHEVRVLTLDRRLARAFPSLTTIPQDGGDTR
ncbi:MAG: type II toxin-antitoxin system VapC family toxin [Brachybacterium tyrofermentans]